MACSRAPHGGQRTTSTSTRPHTGRLTSVFIEELKNWTGNERDVFFLQSVRCRRAEGRRRGGGGGAGAGAVKADKQWEAMRVEAQKRGSDQERLERAGRLCQHVPEAAATQSRPAGGQARVGCVVSPPVLHHVHWEARRQKGGQEKGAISPNGQSS